MRARRGFKMKLYDKLIRYCDLIPYALIAVFVRIIVAHTFFVSGQTKIEGPTIGGFLMGLDLSFQIPTAIRDATFILFENDYKIPLLSPNLAAYLATFAEHILPTLQSRYTVRNPWLRRVPPTPQYLYKNKYLIPNNNMTIDKIKHLQMVQIEAAKHYSNLIEARKMQSANAQFRKDILDRQRVMNYQSEYDRLRAHLENSALPYQTRPGVKARAAKLQQLGAKATYFLKILELITTYYY